MINKKSKNLKRQVRHTRVRAKISGTAERPRLNVYRSAKNIYAQIIDDVAGITLVSASTLDDGIKGETANCGNKVAAKLVGSAIAKKAAEKGIEDVVFDRGGYLYHGRVKSLAEGTREA